jgi:hypothetical protein
VKEMFKPKQSEAKRMEMELIKRKLEEMNQPKAITTDHKINYMADRAWL